MGEKGQAKHVGPSRGTRQTEAWSRSERVAGQNFEHMHDRRRLVLDALRVRGALTLDELARELRLTRTATANHLARLQANGLVTRVGLRAGKRRPSITYGLTEQADRSFPQEYETLALHVLDETARAGSEQLDRVLRRVGERWLARDLPPVRSLRGRPRLERAVQIVAERGFMPSLEPSSRGLALRNHNCPIARACGAHHQVADMVKRWVEALVGTRVQRTACICKGAPACEYSILPKHRRHSKIAS